MLTAQFQHALGQRGEGGSHEPLAFDFDGEAVFLAFQGGHAEERHREHRDDQQRVQPSARPGLASLRDRGGRPAGRVEGQGSGENDA